MNYPSESIVKLFDEATIATLTKIYNLTMIAMVVIGLLCFIALFFIKAGYGKFRSSSWGVSFSNKIGWILMEIPTLIVTLVIIVIARQRSNFLWRCIVVLPFVAHYIQRTFIFPFLLRGKSKMPFTIILMGAVFNTINAFLINLWVFVLSDDALYSMSYLLSPKFIIGCLIFVMGLIINISSDSYIRSLRKPGDSAHYFPCKRFYRYVTSANYFGEIVEWVGFAIATWSLPGLLFVYWTAANLVPRSFAINKAYKEEFPLEFAQYNPKRIIPFIL